MSIFAALSAIAPTAAKVAALLGISRQAYSQAIKRGRLSESVTLRAAAILGLDPGAALLSNATPADPTPPVGDSAAHPGKNAQGIQIIRTKATKKNEGQADNCGPMKNNHVVVLQNYPPTQTALDVIRWCLAIAKVRPDSPRFSYYVSRWNVPDKIARAKAAGSFDSLTAEAGPIDPAWLRLVPAALEEWLRFWSKFDKHHSDITPASCHNTQPDKQLSPAA